MNRWLNVALITLIGTLGMASTADSSWWSRGGSGGSCWGDYCCGDIDIIGEYLYIRPHNCDLSFVIKDDRQYEATDGGSPVTSDTFLPLGPELGVDPDYESAFRVGLGYVFNCGCNDITVTYARLCTRDRLRTAASGEAGGLWITFAHPRNNSLRLNNRFAVVAPASNDSVNATAEGRVRVEYDTVDAVVSTRGRKGCNIWYRGSVGLKWAEIRVSKSAKYQGTLSTPAVFNNSVVARLEANLFTDVDHKSEYWGVGPRMSFDLRYDLFCGFGIGARAGVALLAGDSCNRIRERDRLTELDDVGLDPITPIIILAPTEDQPIDVHSRSRVHVVPELDARLGVNYLWCCGQCFSVVVEVGWEFVSYINAVGRVRFNDDGGTSREVCDSFSIDGLYVAFRVTI